MVTNKQVIFSKIPSTYPVIGEHITINNSQIDLESPLGDGEFIVKTLVDPYMRGRMRDPSIKSYATAFIENQPMVGHTMMEVIKSNNSSFCKVHDLIYGMGRFEEYTKWNDAEANEQGFVVRNDPRTLGLPISYYVGVLGMPGLTAYYGLYEIGKIKKGETIYISAASGAVGQLVVQLSKAQGLRVVGSAGSDQKVAYLKEIGIDAAFNYKTDDIDTKLNESCPNGIDVYYENVGGEMLEIVLTHMNNFGRIVSCGMVSQYNLAQPEKVGNLMNIVAKRLKFDGFIIFDHPDVEHEFLKKIAPMVVNKKIKYQETHTKGIENTPKALLDVLNGNNFGKQVVDVASL